MTESNQKSTRRAFFLQGSAVLGAGVATTLAPGAMAPDRNRSQPDLDAIRQLHIAFTTLVEQQSYEAAAELFVDDAHLQLSGATAHGKRAIQQLFASHYRDRNGSAFHSAYRQSSVRTNDTVTIGDGGRQATATFHIEAEVCTPLQDDCTVAQMARMQGHVAERHWESGRFEGQYVKASGQWKVASLSYESSISTPSAMSTHGMSRGL